MNSALASIGKNFILLTVLILSVVNLYTFSLNWRELFAIQCLFGVAYVFLNYYEYMNVSYKASLPVQRYRYFTNSFFMFRAIKIGVFISFTILLFAAESKIRYIYPVCAIIACTEAIVLYLKYKNSLCFVNIYANYLLIVQTRFTKLFASEILIIEFRHNIFYFVKKDKKSIQIKLEHIKARDRFIQSINEWIVRNNILVSAESKVKIEELIS